MGKRTYDKQATAELNKVIRESKANMTEEHLFKPRKGFLVAKMYWTGWGDTKLHAEIAWKQSNYGVIALAERLKAIIKEKGAVYASKVFSKEWDLIDETKDVDVQHIFYILNEMTGGFTRYYTEPKTDWIQRKKDDRAQMERAGKKRKGR